MVEVRGGSGYERAYARSGFGPDPVRDSGVSTVFACLTVALFLAVTAMGIRLGGAMLSRQQAETAADLGALAGAARVIQGNQAACASALAVVTANGASMTSCSIDGLDLLIEVQVVAPGLVGTAGAHARAGPVTTP